jgi:predicted metal-dependent peptidase
MINDIQAHPKIVDSIKYFINRNPFWGEFSLYISFKESKEIPTAGVRFRGIKMEYLYNPKFIDSLTSAEMRGVHIHELMHLLCNHMKRTVLGNYKHNWSNIVQDMIINSSIKDLCYSDVCLPKDCFYLPKSYTGRPLFEELYEYMMQQKEIYDKEKQESENQGGNGDSAGDDEENQDGDGKDKYPNSKVPKDVRDALDAAEKYEFDVHLPSDISEDMKEQIIKDIKNTLKVRGLMPADIENMLEKLNPPKKNYLKKIAVSINKIKGNKKIDTITRPNRRGIDGIKGKKTIGNTINVILDVSGSMHGYLEKVLSYIFMNEYVINLVQCDTKIQKHVVVTSKKELQKMKLNGFGGTTLQPGIDYVKEKLPKIPMILLTDGYTDSLNFGDVKALVITCDVNPTVSGKNVSIINIKK